MERNKTTDKEQTIEELEVPVVKKGKAKSALKTEVIEPIVRATVPEMEVVEDRTVRYIKIGGGTFRATIDGKRRIIKRGEKFRALPEEIPVAFRDVVKALDAGDEQLKTQLKRSKVQPVKTKFNLRPEGDLFHVVNESGKIVTDVALPESEAKQLVKHLEK